MINWRLVGSKTCQVFFEFSLICQLRACEGFWDSVVIKGDLNLTWLQMVTSHKALVGAVTQNEALRDL